MAGNAALNYVAGRPLPAVEILGKVGAGVHERSRVLIPLDGSNSDISTLNVAAESVTREAEIVLLHIRLGPDEERYPDVIAAMSQSERLKRLIDSEHIFARANAILAPRGLVSVDQVAAQGEPEEIILRYANQLEANMVVLTIDGDRNTIGARGVTRQLSCPVLIARERAAAAGM